MKKGLGVWLCSIILLLITSCGKKNDYRMVIPADAGIVMGIDSKSITKKAGVNGETERANIEAFLKNKVDSSLYSYALELMKNPDESGLDFSKLIYAYFTSAGEVGLIVKVNDEKKLKVLFDKLSEEKVCPALEMKNGVYYVSLDKEVVAAFNESALLLVGNLRKDASLVERGIALLNQKEEQSFLSKKEQVAAFEALRGDVTAVFSLGTMVPPEMMAMVKGVIPENVFLSDLSMLMTCQFEKGKITAQLEGLYLTEAAKEWARKSEEMTMPLKGIFMPKDNQIVWAGFGVKGEKLFDMLMEYPQYAQQMKPMEPILRKMFAAIEGDLSLLMPSTLGGMEMTLNVELKKGEGTGFLETLSGLMQGTGMPVVVAGDKEYSMAIPMMGEITFGLKGENQFYLGIKSPNVQVMETSPANWLDDMKGNRLYYRFDVQALAKNITPLMDMQENVAFMRLFDYICIKALDYPKVTMEVVMENQEENVLKQIVDLAKSLNE